MYALLEIRVCSPAKRDLRGFRKVIAREYEIDDVTQAFVDQVLTGIRGLQTENRIVSIEENSKFANHRAYLVTISPEPNDAICAMIEAVIALAIAEDV